MTTIQISNTDVTVVVTDTGVELSVTQGQAGANGVGVPVGGATGTVLTKTSAADYATAWSAISHTINLQEFYDDTPNGGSATGTTWTKPAGAFLVLVEASGGGASGVTGTGLTGGVAGASGAYETLMFAASDLTATVTVAVGAGTAGGTANEIAGATTFGTSTIYVTATGARGQTAPTTIGTRLINVYGAGGTTSAAGCVGGRGSGGGGGGGSTGAQGGTGGSARKTSITGSATPATGGGGAGGLSIIGGAGGDGVVSADSFGFGSGAGGGGSGGGTGGKGIRGSGGGGGGVGSPAGTGGRGGNGYVRVTTFCS